MSRDANPQVVKDALQIVVQLLSVSSHHPRNQHKLFEFPEYVARVVSLGIAQQHNVHIGDLAVLATVKIQRVAGLVDEQLREIQIPIHTLITLFFSSLLGIQSMSYSSVSIWICMMPLSLQNATTSLGSFSGIIDTMHLRCRLFYKEIHAI